MIWEALSFFGFKLRSWKIDQNLMLSPNSFGFLIKERDFDRFHMICKISNILMWPSGEYINITIQNPEYSNASQHTLLISFYSHH